jgi:hypothetical protein
MRFIKTKAWMVRLLCSLAACAQLQACSIAMGSKFTEMPPQESDFAHLYFLRAEGGKAFDQGGRGTTGAFPDIAVNGRDVGSLKRGGYLFVRVPPGQVSIKTLDTLSWWPLPTISREFKAEKGARYFYMLTTSYGGQTTGTPSRRIVVVDLAPVSEAEAAPILKELQLPNGSP